MNTHKVDDHEVGQGRSLTIDDLARAGGVVASTVRLYQSRGLLAPPARRGRVGYYGTSHLARLRLIGQLQERGFSLAGIKELLDGMEEGASLGAILGLGDAPSTWTAEKPEAMPLAELAGFLPQVDFTADVVQRIVDLGLVALADDPGSVTVHSPSFLHIGSELAALGVPPEVILDEYDALQVEAGTIATRFTDVFRTHLWEPFVDSGLPAERIAELVGALEKLGPLAEGVVVLSLRQALQGIAERFIQAEATRLGIEIPRPGRPQVP